MGPAAEQEYPVQLFVDKTSRRLVNPITKPKFKAHWCQKCRTSGIIGLHFWNEDGIDMATNHDGQPGMSISHIKTDTFDQIEVEAVISSSQEGLRAAMKAGQQETTAKGLSWRPW